MNSFISTSIVRQAPVGSSIASRQKLSNRFGWVPVLRKVTAPIVVMLSLLVITQAQAPDGQSSTRGFQPNGSYALSNIESIGLSGGNLNYSLPLAVLPPGRGGRLKPAVYLLYNSKLFDTQVRMCLGASCTFHYTQTDIVPSEFGGWTYGTNYFVLTRNRANNYVDGAPYPYSVFKYKTEIFFPDGSSHQLRPYGDTPSEEYYTVCPGASGTTRTYYTTDGSYLRVQFSTDGASWTIYFPDGSTVNFDNSTGVQTTTDGNGNFYTTQNVTLQNGNPATVVTDQLDRKITIEKPVTGPHYVRVNGVGGNEVVTSINWGTTSPQGKKWLWKVFDDGPSQFHTFVSTTPVVTSINLPNGLIYQFQYNSDVFDPLNPTKSVGWGELYKTTLPTGATVQYSYFMDNRHGNETDDIIEPKQVLWDHPTNKQLVYTESYDGASTQRTETWNYNINVVQGGSAEGQTDQATATAPDGGSSTEYFFVNTGDPHFGKAGLSYKSVKLDGSQVERFWQENVPYNGTGDTKNFYVKTEFVSIPDSTTALVKTAIHDYVYDKNGNVTQVAEYDWVPYGDVSRGADGKPTGAIPASAQLKRVFATGFYNATPSADSSAYSAYIYNQTTSPNLRTATKWTEVRANLLQSSAQSRTEFDYDDPSTKGNLTARRDWDSTRGGWSDPLTTSNSISASFQYNQYGSPTLSTNAVGTQTQLTYGPIGGFSDLYPTQVKTAYQTTVQRTETREYDFSTSLVTRVTDVDNNVSTATSYDVFGRPTLLTAAEGKPEETRRRIEYSDAFNRMITKSDLITVGDEKLVSIQHYDQLGRIRLSRQLEDAAAQSATDETTGIKVQTRYLYSGSSIYQLVSNPYRASTSSAASTELTMGWTRSRNDNGGRLVEVQTFWSAGLPAPWGTNTSGTGTVVTTYDANFTTVTDQAGKLRRTMLNGLGQLVRVDEPNSSNSLGPTTAPNQPTSYTYDGLGNLLTVTQGAQTRTFLYNSLSRLTSATNPESGTINYDYYDDGNLHHKTDARGVASTYVYDPLGRNISVDYSNTPTLNPDINRYYDGATNGKGRFWYDYAGASTSGGQNLEHHAIDSYDALGRPLVMRQLYATNGIWSPTYQSSRSYNQAGEVTWQVYPSSHIVAPHYDTAGRLDGLTGTLGDGTSRSFASNVTYTASGQMQEEKFGTATPLYHKLRYNSRGQLYDIRLSTVAWATDPFNWNRGCLATYHDSGYHWGGNPGVDTGPDNNGNVLRAQYYRPGDDQISTFSATQQDYIYDELNRLTSTTEWYQNGQGYTQQFVQAYSYDRWGNRTISIAGTSPVLNPTNFEVEPSTNRLLAQGDTPLPNSNRKMRYDEVGNVTNDSWSGHGNDSPGVITRLYDAENRMTAALDSSGGTSYYTYDADGHRTRRNIGGLETWQIYGFDGELLAEYAAGTTPNTAQKEYGYRNGQLLITATSVSAPTSGLVAYWKYDENSGTTAADSSGSGLSGTLTNGPTWTAGHAGAALNFDGVDDMVTDSGLSNVTNNFTISFWTQPGAAHEVDNESTSGWSGISGQRYAIWPDHCSSCSTDAGAGISVGTNGVSVYEHADNYMPATLVYSASLSGWTHITVVYENKQPKLYINGSLVRIGLTSPMSFVHFNPFLIGGGTYGYYAGKLDDLRVYNRALSASEVATLPINSTINWLVTDHLGTPRMIADETGSLAGIKRHDYLSFGEELFAGTGNRMTQQGYSADGIRQQFTKYERDVETDLDYARARYFDSVPGRFTSPDPLMASGTPSIPQSWNRYTYALNNPIKLVDPTGLIWCYHYLDKKHTRIGIGWFNKVPKGYFPMQFNGNDELSITLADGTTAVLSANSSVATIYGQPSRATSGGYANTALIRETRKQTAPIPAATAVFVLISLNYGYALEASGSMLFLNAVATGILVPAKMDKDSSQTQVAGITMDEAVDRAVNFVGPDGKMETTSGGNFQFRVVETNANGDREARMARLDVNPADGHVQRLGPHLNLERQINSRTVSNPHIPIDPATIRPGDIP